MRSGSHHYTNALVQTVISKTGSYDILIHITAKHKNVVQVNWKSNSNALPFLVNYKIIESESAAKNQLNDNKRRLHNYLKTATHKTVWILTFPSVMF